LLENVRTHTTAPVRSAHSAMIMLPPAAGLMGYDELEAHFRLASRPARIGGGDGYDDWTYLGAPDGCCWRITAVADWIATVVWGVAAT
jgi:hypothetical protein